MFFKKNLDYKVVFLLPNTVRKIFLNNEFLSTQKMRLPQKRVHQDHSNDTPQYEFHVGACWLPFNVALGLSCLIHSMKPS